MKCFGKDPQHYTELNTRSYHIYDFSSVAQTEGRQEQQGKARQEQQQQMAGTCYPNDAQFKGNCDAYFFKAAPIQAFNMSVSWAFDV